MPTVILPQIPDFDILHLSNNQPLPDPRLFTEPIHELVEEGNGLLLVHVTTWYIRLDDWSMSKENR